jgi:serine/threonine protein kinase
MISQIDLFFRTLAGEAGRFSAFRRAVFLIFFFVCFEVLLDSIRLPLFVLFVRRLKAALEGLKATTDTQAVVVHCIVALSMLDLSSMLDFSSSDIVKDKMEKILQELCALIAPPAVLAPAQPPESIAERLASWVVRSDDTAAIKDCQFALYCALCGVIDERVLDHQLRGCDEPIGKQLRQLFKHNDDIVKFLLENKAVDAVKEALNGLLQNNPQCTTAAAFFEVVRRTEIPEGCSESLWCTVVMFFGSLVRRQDCVQNASELPVSALVLFETGAFATFTQSQKRQLAVLYGQEVVFREVDVAADAFAEVRVRAPDVVVRVGDANVLFGVVTPSDADEEGILDDRCRLVWLARTNADLQRAVTNEVGATSFGLQVVGKDTEITLLVQIRPSFYVNLLLLRTNVGTCELTEAIDFLALMVAIRSVDQLEFRKRVAALLLSSERMQVDLFGRARDDVEPAPLPTTRPTVRDRHQIGKRRKGTPREVTLGTIVTDHNGRAVVRGAGGDVVFKVLTVDPSARHAREDAVHELRVHKMLTRLAAPHVVPLLSHFEAPVALPGQAWLLKSIVMLLPLCERVIGDELINARDAVEAGEGLLRALAALHRLAVLHGDVKWSNTLWMDGGDARRLVLADFGLAQQLDVEGRATLHRGLGTDRYMAPEVRHGSALSVTAAADVYSAGVALRKLPAHAVCAPLQALATQMCAEKAYARVSAAEACGEWRRAVVPALLQVASMEVG